MFGMPLTFQTIAVLFRLLLHTSVHPRSAFLGSFFLYFVLCLQMHFIRQVLLTNKGSFAIDFAYSQLAAPFLGPASILLRCTAGCLNGPPFVKKLQTYD